jgi:trk system potassium uptake protein TrkH
MNYKLIANYIGNILRIEGLFMIPALLVSLYHNEFKCVLAFGISIAALLVIGQLMHMIKPQKRNVFVREGFAIVSLSWLAISLFGALPFFISREIPNFIDCFFETVSGFTTTGSSILSNVEALSKGLLYWRSFSHWLGGMGVLVFLLAVVPNGKDNDAQSLYILRAESPGPTFGKLVSKMRQTAQILYIIYIALTIIEIILLFAGGMPLFDSVLNSFATAGTGGFGIKNASIGAYDSYYLQGVIAVFMLLFGVNFNIYYLLLARDFKLVFKNEELRFYIITVLVSVTVIAINIRSMFSSWFDAFHHSFFQVSSIITTTGFSTTDFSLWPELSRYILVVLMLMGACAGSTGGGFKVQRFVILWKSGFASLRKMVHPNSVNQVKSDDKILRSEVLQHVLSYLILYLGLVIASFLLISLDDMDFGTAVSAVSTCINNIGPGMNRVGPMENFSFLSDFSKMVLSADMLLGRLEIFPILVLLSPSVWRKSF